MKDLYTKKFLFDTLFLLSKEIEDLSAWSAYNDDIANEEIAELQEKSNQLRKKLIDLDLQGTLQSDDADEKGGDNNNE